MADDVVNTTMKALTTKGLLREALFHLKRHNEEYHHVTPVELIERIEKALEPSPLLQAVLDKAAELGHAEPNMGKLEEMRDQVLASLTLREREVLRSRFRNIVLRKDGDKMTDTKLQRLSKVNELLEVIGSCGRHFFHYEDRTSYLEMDHRGRIWFIDAYNGKRIYTHNKNWRGFTEGGTLCELVRCLRDFVVHEKPVSAKAFGPWPEWICGGDLWGYGEDMQQVRDAAARLEIIEPTA